ncbi:BrnT family toxin [Zavarzinia sp. CC-PAN008]|uniref:BrnT family toxin n=1 Tax=Zavarzinia sp. CC-PAN008 TaxID=3243332 RepID=UPI003F747E5F
MLIWDEAKRAANIAKHGVDFAAARGFVWESALIQRDGREDYGEERMIALGFLGTRLHVLVYTHRGEDTRIISLRKANAREKAEYADQAG